MFAGGGGFDSHRNIYFPVLGGYSYSECLGVLSMGGNPMLFSRININASEKIYLGASNNEENILRNGQKNFEGIFLGVL
jgi:hypothetical protein